jgi:protocatechuate 3,4-dioxygenase alpha subunit
MSLRAMASQTVGPFFQIGLSWLYREELCGPDTSGERVSLRGRVLDGDGQPVPDALLEIWQADAEGRYPHPEDARSADCAPDFRGFARVATQGDGSFRLRTIKPGSVAEQAPHLNVHVFMRGLLRAVATRIYFPDEPRNAQDPVLARVPEARRATLIARHGEPGVLIWDVRMQGEGETVFFEL